MCMIITNYRGQSTLRAYGPQLAEKSRLARAKAPRNPGPKDEVILSQESKKRLTAQKITQQLIRRVTVGSELQIRIGRFCRFWAENMASRKCGEERR